LFHRLGQTIGAEFTVAKAKVFRDEYQLQASHIACQLLIKQDTTWYGTDILCQTNIMEESELFGIKAIIVQRPNWFLFML
jgi:hypothetical protein